MGGRKPLPTLVKIATGNRGHQALPRGEPMPEGPPVMPTWLQGGRELELWADLVRMCFWLKEPDSHKMAAWAHLTAKMEDRKYREAQSMTEFGKWMMLGSELGLDPISRARMGMVKRGTAKEDPARKYFSAA